MRTMLLENCEVCRRPIPTRFITRHLEDCHGIYSRINKKPVFNPEKVTEFEAVTTKSMKFTGDLRVPVGARGDFVRKHLIVGDLIRVQIWRVRP